MYQLELGYKTRKAGLLPGTLKQQFPASVKSSEEGNILLEFDTKEAREEFMKSCGFLKFTYRVLPDGDWESPWESVQ